MTSEYNPFESPTHEGTSESTPIIRLVSCRAFLVRGVVVGLSTAVVQVSVIAVFQSQRIGLQAGLNVSGAIGCFAPAILMWICAVVVADRRKSATLLIGGVLTTTIKTSAGWALITLAARLLTPAQIGIVNFVLNFFLNTMEYTMLSILFVYCLGQEIRLRRLGTAAVFAAILSPLATAVFAVILMNRLQDIVAGMYVFLGLSATLHLVFLSGVLWLTLPRNSG
jgi:hypothetical protein